MKFTRCGLDIAKQIFQVHGVNEHGVVKGHRTLPRTRVLEYFAPATLAHHRRRGPNGHESTLDGAVQFARKGRSRVRYAVAVKPKQEAELFKAALRAGIRYAESRGAVEFEPTDSASDKALYVYRLLVHDKIITPMPEDQVGEKTVRHRLASWYANLPPGHPLLS